MAALDHLENMVLALNRIEFYTNGLSEDSFNNDIKIQDAVAYCILRFGIAASKLPKEIYSKYYSEIDWCLFQMLRELSCSPSEDIWQIIFAEEIGLLCNKKKIEEILRIENGENLDTNDSSSPRKTNKNNSNVWDANYKYPIKTKSSIWTVKKK